MNSKFEKFAEKLAMELQQELPGFSAQKCMAPLGRKQAIDYLRTDITPKKSAVLILLYAHPIPFAINTVLILRPESEGKNHSGQISFPGGSVDNSDKNMSETALRETEEEIGIERKSVTIIGELSPLYIPISNFMVQPFVGILRNVPSFKIHPLEVAELLEVKIHELGSDKNRKSAERFLKTSNTKMEVPCYDINGKIIWGATAMIIAELLEIIGRIK